MKRIVPAHEPAQQKVRHERPALTRLRRAERGAPMRRQGAYRVADDVARRIWAGHPWIYREAFLGRTPSEPSGALVDILAGNGEFVARGFVDQDHAIVVRVLSRDARISVEPGSGVIAARLATALSMRRLLFGAAPPSAMRLFTGDSEGLPGVIIDRYGEFAIVQWLSSGALAYRDELLEALVKHAAPRGIYEQKRVRPLAGQAPPEPARHVAGEEAPLELIVEEDACRFAVDVTAPLGVGLFPDLRAGRDLVARWARGRRVLNLFSYTGAFSVRALKAGAASVVAVDTAARAHARAVRNVELSGLSAASMQTITGDAQKTLDRLYDRGQRFDLVVSDPPTFAHGKDGGRGFSVARDLVDVLTKSLAVLEPGGLLAAATNSIKISAAELDRALAEASAHAKVDARIVERVGLPPDFPVSPGFPEGNYLKFVLVLRA